ncbi:MAG TPA: 16S rRNA (guanine(966)-N(2))-methyltransferase RsmD, partial [Acidobacteriaceae bacterium]
MRVIAGEFRSRQLRAPRGMDTRPTSDRLRETLFNVLGARVEGARFADLYAGSGVVGIEAVSRGAELVWFAENAPAAVAAIRANLAALKIGGCAVEDRGVARLLQSMLKAARADADLVFLDPPYEAAEEYRATLEFLGRHAAEMLAPGAMVVAEHARKLPLAEQFGVLERTRVLEQGDAALSFYRVGAGGKADPSLSPPASKLAGDPDTLRMTIHWCSRSSWQNLAGEAAAGVLAGLEVDGEGDFAVGLHVPAETVQLAIANLVERDALPAEAGGFPEQACRAEGGYGVEAGEQDEIGFGCGENLHDGTQRKVKALLGGARVDEVGVPSGDGEQVVRARTGPHTRGQRGVAEAERAGGEKAASAGRFDEQQKSAARERVLFAGDALRPDDLACGSDERRGVQNLCGPCCGECGGGRGHRRCSQPRGSRGVELPSSSSEICGWPRPARTILPMQVTGTPARVRGTNPSGEVV